MIQCSKCNVPNSIGTQFCSNCGNAISVVQPQSMKNSGNLKTILIIIGCVLGSCVLCGIIGGIKETVSPTPKDTNTPANSQKEDSLTVTADKERNEHLKQAKIALEDGFNEKEGKFGRIEDAEKHLAEIRLYDKQYKDAQPFMDELKRRKQIIEAMPTPKEEAMAKTKININGKKSGFGTVFMGDISVDNPTKYAIKDLQIDCQMMGGSGTTLGTKNQTVYEIVPAKSKKTFRKINFGFIDNQVSQFNCSLSDLEMIQ